MKSLQKCGKDLKHDLYHGIESILFGNHRIKVHQKRKAETMIAEEFGTVDELQ